MKCLAILLVCVAAANAFSYSYSYYCAHNFYVYPSSRCYCYHVYFPSTWCSSSYYNPILKVYPGDDCSNSDWQETAPSAIMNEVRNLLNAALQKMTTEMYNRRNQFISKIDSIHAEYKSYYKKFLSQFYTYRFNCGYFVGINYIKERDDKIRAYCASLDKTRNDVYNKYTNAIAQKITAIKAYHDKIVKQGTECLNTRLTKIKEYKESMIKKAYDAVVKFGKLHISILNQKKECYSKALMTAFGNKQSWWTHLKGALSVTTYYSTQRMLVEKHIRAYTYKLSDHFKKLVKFYTCAYKCYMSNACLRFYSKSYSNYCRSTHFSYKSNFHLSKYMMAPFCYTYKHCTYNHLKTCDVGQDARNAAKVISDLKKKMSDTLAANDSKYTSWKNTWVGYFRAYKQAYANIVRCRHTWYISYLRKQYISCNGYLLAINVSSLSKLQADLEKKLREACAVYNQQLDAKIAAADQAHATNQANYKKAMESFISKLQAKYTECASRKATAIADYKKKLIAKRDAQRAVFVANLYKARDANIAHFDKLLAHYHGSNYKSTGLYKCLFDSYSASVNGMVSGLISKFDSFWRTTIPGLVLHYTCCYKCAISARCSTTFHCGGFYSWCYKLPLSNCYSYQYSLYVRYH